MRGMNNVQTDVYVQGKARMIRVPELVVRVPARRGRGREKTF